MRAEDLYESYERAAREGVEELLSRGRRLFMASRRWVVINRIAGVLSYGRGVISEVQAALDRGVPTGKRLTVGGAPAGSESDGCA